MLFQEGYLIFGGLRLRNSHCFGAWDPGRNPLAVLNLSFCGNERKKMQRFLKAAWALNIERGKSLQSSVPKDPATVKYS